MDDAELIARLRGWAKDIQEGSEAIWAMDQDLKGAADRIEALRAKLAVAVEALEKLDVGEGWAAHIARAALAQIRGDE